MAVEFCECGGMLIPSYKGKKCRSCGKSFKGGFDEVIKTKREKKDITVIENNAPDLPTTDEKECPKCGNKRAYFWMIQTRSSDEPPTQFFRCTSCKHTWREYK
jgi:DNA-directed RNA polymerase subunit M